MEHVQCVTAWVLNFLATPAGLSLVTILSLAGAMTIGSLMVPWFITFLRFRPQNLRKKYNASWALVTGGSSGIGRSLAFQLAGQGLNVVIAAVPDALLLKTAEELRVAHPDVTIRSVGVNLAAQNPDEFMAPIIAATEDVLVQIVFNNAGYMVTGFFDRTPLPKWLANFNCNSAAPISITHHFVGRMRAAGVRGCVVFTSSPANIIPSPFSAMYGATKALITHFATSLACELGPSGIDVAVIHPSPVNTAFYAGAHALPTLHLFKGTATGPDHVADVMIRGVGRSVVIDQGYYPIIFRLMLRLVDVTALADLLVVLAPLTADYKALNAAQHSTPQVAAPTPAAAEPAATPDSTNKAARKRAASPASNKRK